MTEEESLSFKKRLKAFGLGLLEQRITAARTAMNAAQEAANNEEKSSAGDKYETARAMGHLEKDMHARQLAQHLQDLALLQSVPADQSFDTVQTGALVQCDDLWVFIATGLGRQQMDSNLVLFLSPQAPLAQSLLQKKRGGRFSFQQKERQITAIY